MKPCTDVVALLVDYVEERLAPGVQAQLERHLGACPNCVAYVRTYRSTLSLLRSLREEDLPPDLRCTLHAFLDRHCGN